MQRMMRYFRQFYAQCGKAVLLYLLLTIVHKILAFISPPITQWLIDAAIAGNASEFWRMLIFEVLTTLAFMARCICAMYTATSRKTAWWHSRRKGHFPICCACPIRSCAKSPWAIIYI